MKQSYHSYLRRVRLIQCIEDRDFRAWLNTNEARTFGFWKRYDRARKQARRNFEASRRKG